MQQPEIATLAPGTVLQKRYHIVHTINRGGFGNVYRATDATFHKDVAVKEAFFNDEETRQQFTLEAQVLLHINDRGVVRGFDSFEEGGRFYLVMEYVEGPNLEELQIDYFKTKRHPIPEAMVLKVMMNVCAATSILHSEHIIHRDIKPANIKLDPNGEPILLDLGLAKLFKDPTSQTLIAARAYTPGYAPPEQCEEEGSTTEATDIYALGATTYYALTGRQPWEALKRLVELQSGRTDMPPPSHYIPSINPMTDDVVMQALSLNPAHRFATAVAMQKACGHILEQMGLQILQPPQVAVTPVVPDPAVRQPVAPPPQPAVAAVPPQVIPPVAAKPVVASPQTKPYTPTKPMTQLPSAPEPFAPRIIVTKRRSAHAGIALLLAVASLCPAAIPLALIALPMGLRGLFVISRSGGVRRGRGQATLAIVLSLVGIAEGIVWILALINGKLF